MTSDRGGLFSGAVDRGTLAADDFRSNDPRSAADAINRNLAALASLRPVADRHEAAPAQVALAWVPARSVFAIPGTKQLGYPASNIAAPVVILTAENLRLLDRSYPIGTFAGARYAAEGIMRNNMWRGSNGDSAPVAGLAHAAFALKMTSIPSSCSYPDRVGMVDKL